MGDALVGHAIGHYQLHQIIGQGGMAVVYRAAQPRIDRDVAIKVIAQSYARYPAFVRRFEQEMRATAHLQHPHILPVYDVGIEGEQLYMVMAYCSGGTLARRIAEQPGGLPIEEALCVTIQVAAAIDHAHKQGIIHRDIKPGNILLDGRGNSYLGDFGIAQLADSEHLPAFGTFTYMAPEVAEGDPATPASDLYSLGIVVYEMLVGHRPFEAHDRETLLELYADHVKVDIREARPDLPPGVQVVIEQALSRDPVSRPAYASALAQALLRASGLSGLPCAEIPATSSAGGSAVIADDNWRQTPDDDDWEGDGPHTPPPFEDEDVEEKNDFHDDPSTDPGDLLPLSPPPPLPPPPSARVPLPKTAVGEHTVVSVPAAVFATDDRPSRVPMNLVLILVWALIIFALLGLAVIAVLVIPSLTTPTSIGFPAN